MNKKRSIVIMGRALALGGCLSNCAPAECRRLTEPGVYEVHACDVFPGPFGIDMIVKGLGQYGDVGVSYLDSNGRKLFDDFFSPSAVPVAHYRINVYHAGEDGTLVRTNNVVDLYAKCVEIMNGRSSDPSRCSEVAPTEALPGDVLEESYGYFGKTNNLKLPQLAMCAAKGVESTAIYTGKFFNLPPLESGVAQMEIFMDKPSLTGLSHGSTAIWYHDNDNQENIDYQVERCNEKIRQNSFSPGDHELTHLFLRGMSIPRMFNEGLANFVPGTLAGEEMGWNTPDSQCKENGIQMGHEIKPYTKYDQADPNISVYYYSGWCFWEKLAYDYGVKIIPEVMRVLDQHRWEQKFTFETALSLTGVDLRKYHRWGL